VNVEEAILARSTADLSDDSVVDFSLVAKGPGTEIDSVEFQASVRWRHGDMLVCSFWKNRIWAAIHQMTEISTDAVSCKIKGLVPAIRPPWFVGFETRRFCLGLHAYIRITTRQDCIQQNGNVSLPPFGFSSTGDTARGGDVGLRGLVATRYWKPWWIATMLVCCTRLGAAACALGWLTRFM